jgi:hypothetical protein
MNRGSCGKQLLDKCPELGQPGPLSDLVEVIHLSVLKRGIIRWGMANKMLETDTFRLILEHLIGQQRTATLDLAG